MRSILLTLAFALSVSNVAIAQQVVALDARAQEILKQARAAIWDETKAGPLQSLSLNASRRLASRGNQIDMTLEALLHDKFMQTIVIGVGLGFGNDLILIRTINGAQAWSEVISPGGLMAGASKGKKRGGDGAMQKMANNMSTLAARISAELSGMPDDFGKTDDGSGDKTADHSLVIQAGFTPLLLVLLLTSPPLLPIECAYAGQAKTQDGQTADVLDLKGPHSFSARLFLNQKTRRTMMLTYKTRLLGSGQVKGQTHPPTQPDPEETEIEARWTASDYRNLNGLTLPHRLTRFIGGQIAEEIEIQKVKVNPELKPDKFVKKEKQK